MNLPILLLSKIALGCYFGSKKSEGIMENREETRKAWLITTLAQAALNVLFNFLFLLLTPQSSEILYISLFLFLSLLTYAVPTYILIHCAYKKYGTKFLTFLLVVSPLGFIAYLVDEIKGIFQLASVEMSTWLILSILAFAMNVITGSLWYWYSLKLRKINKEALCA